MAELLVLPRMTDTMEEGFVAEVNIKVGDKVNSGDAVAEVETDKASMPFETFQEGTVLHLEVKQGDSVPVGGLIAILGEEGEDFSALLEEARNSASAPAAEETAPEPAAAPGPTPAPAPSPAPAAAPAPAPAPAPMPVMNGGGNGRLKASPLAKRMASDAGVDIAQIQGTGDEGRIVKKDVEAFLAKPAAAGGTTTAFVSRPAVVGQERFTEEPVSQMRKTIARRLGESKFQAPHFYLTISVRMNETMEVRKRMNDISPVKISFNDMVIKAASMALRQHPAVNSSWLGDKIRYNEHVHLGMAVAVEDGLVVPVIRFADALSLSQIASETKVFAQKAKDMQLSMEEMQGNTFSISNLGMMGIEEFTAIINPPDACIMAVGGIKQELALRDGELVENHMMKVTMSCDHRVVDGATGAQFLATFKAYLEDPATMLV